MPAAMSDSIDGGAPRQPWTSDLCFTDPAAKLWMRLVRVENDSVELLDGFEIPMCNMRGETYLPRGGRVTLEVDFSTQ